MTQGREAGTTIADGGEHRVPAGPSSDWMRVLFEGIDDAVFVHDADGNIREANPAACRRLGYTRAELLQLNTRDIDDPEFASGFADRLRNQLRAGSFRCEGVHRTRDGRRIPVDINTSAITIDGAPAVLAVMRDITKRKLAEEELAKQGQLLRSILDNMGDAVLVADIEQHIVLFNPAAERVFGPGLLQGSFQLHLPDRITRLAELPLSRCCRGESFDQLEVFIRHPDSPRGLWGSLTGRPLRERGGDIKGAVLVCRDITAHKLAEKRLRAQYLVSRALARGDNLDTTANTLLAVLGDALDFDAAVWWRVDADTVLECLATWQVPDPALSQFLAETCLGIKPGTSELPVDVLAGGRPRVWEIRASPWAPLPRWTTAADAGLHVALAFGAYSAGRPQAVLEFWGRATEDDADEALGSLALATGSQIGQFLERQHMERALKDSEALYHSLVQCLPQNIFRKDRDGRFTFANKRFCETIGQPLAALLGKTDFDFFPAELAAKYVADDRKIMDTGAVCDLVEQHTRADGQRLHVHVVKTPIIGAEGNVIGVQGIFWDVTEQVEAERQLADSERRYRQLAEATLDGIVLIDGHGRVELFNPAAERLFGFTAAEVLGQPVAPLVPGEFDVFTTSDSRQSLRTRLLSNLGKPVECRGRRKDGSEFPIEIAVSVLGEADEPGQGPRCLAALRDLTERNRMRAVLVQNEKLASIGLLSAGVAHEINNPLSYVSNNLVVLDRDGRGLLALLDIYLAADDAIRTGAPELHAKLHEQAEALDLEYVRDNLGRLLQRTREGVDRVARIVNSLRGLARTDAPRQQETRLPDLIDSSLEIIRGRYRRLGVVVEQEHDPNPTVPCVPTQLGQVILNLLVNAFQAIEAAHRDGGRVSIRTQRRPGELLLSVSDNGVGIPPEHLSRLFDPFFTTKDVGEGTGLGLSISHHIIAGHGGRIEVESEPGQGTTFRIYLPLSGNPLKDNPLKDNPLKDNPLKDNPLKDKRDRS